MGILTKLGFEIFAPNDSGGSARKVDNGEVQVWASEVESLLTTISESPGTTLAYATKALLDADTDEADATIALVYYDSTQGNNGWYSWNDTLSQWDFLRPLADTMVTMTNVAGTANAITADVPQGVNFSNIEFYILVPSSNNTGAVTLERNSEASPVNVKSSSGTDLAADALVAGVPALLWAYSSTELRLMFTGSNSETIDYQGVWSGATTYTDGQWVKSGNVLYLLDAASSLNENPTSGAPWVEVFDFADLDAAVRKATVSKTGAYTITMDENGALVNLDASGGAFTVTLVAAATGGNNFDISFKKVDSSANAVTIDGSGSETIDGELTQVLSYQYDSITLRGDGNGPSAWFIIADNRTPGWRFVNSTAATSVMEFVGTSGGLIRAYGSADTYSLMIGADDTPTTNESPQWIIYGKGHASWPGEAFWTAVTATISGKGRAGMLHLESYTAFRRGFIAGVRTSLTLGSWDANDVPEPDAPAHIFVPTGSLGDDPQVSGLGANGTYNPGLVIEGNISGGGLMSAQYLGGLDHVMHHIYGTTQNSRQMMSVYDHQNERVELMCATGASAPNTVLAYDYQDVYLNGKTGRNTGVVGCEFRAGGQAHIIADGAAPLYLNRLSSDGAVANIAQAGTVEGTISVSGTTVNYNSFHASHWSQLADRSKPDILLGTVCETIDEMCDWYSVRFPDPVTGEMVETEEYSDDHDLHSVGEGGTVEIQVERTVRETIKVTRTEETPVLGEEYRIADGYKFEEKDGHIQATPIERTARDQVYESLPVLLEDGSPVMIPNPNYDPEKAPDEPRQIPMVEHRPMMQTEVIEEEVERDITHVYTVEAEVFRQENIRLVKFQTCDTPASRRVYGVFMGWDKPDVDNDVDALIGALGAGLCRIAPGEVVEGGDILEAAGLGCARKLVLSEGETLSDAAGRILGKVSAAVNVRTYPDGSYLVPMEHARS